MQTLTALGKPNSDYPNRPSHAAWSLETPRKVELPSLLVLANQEQNQTSQPRNASELSHSLSDILWVARYTRKRE